MALVVGVNSYVTVAEADAYFGDRLDVDAWTTAGDTLKSQSLTTAAMMLDGLRWLGEAVDVNQPMAFPRRMEFLDPMLNLWVRPSETEIPIRLKRASFELAYHLLNNDGLLDETGSVADMTVGTIEMKRIYNAPRLPAVVSNLIAPLRVSVASSRMVFRSN